jgi:putative MATE family efflux protein
MRVGIDMTTGSPVKKMLAFSAPLIAGNVLLQLSGFVDGLIVARAAGVAAFAGVAAAAPVAFLATGFLMGFANGFLIPIALSVGAGDREALDRFACAALLMTAAMALLVAVPGALLADRLIALQGTPMDIAPRALTYLRIQLLGVPVPLVFMTLSGIMRAGGDTRTPFRFQMLAMALHLVLDVLLVAVLRLDVAGAALASMLAHGAACALFLRRVLRAHPGIARLMRFGVRSEMAKKLLSLGVPIALTNFMASAGATAFQYAINSQGSMAVAAVAAGDRLLSVALMPGLMMGGVAEVFSGQNCGADRPDRIRAGAAQLIALLSLALTPCALAVVAGRSYLVPFLIGGSPTELTDLAGRYMFWCALAAPLQLTTSILKNVLQGIGKPGRALVASAYDLFVRLAAAIFGAARFGFRAICAVNPLGWALSALALYVTCRAVLFQACSRKAPSAREGAKGSAVAL